MSWPEPPKAERQAHSWWLVVSDPCYSVLRGSLREGCPSELMNELTTENAECVTELSRKWALFSTPIPESWRKSYRGKTTMVVGEYGEQKACFILSGHNWDKYSTPVTAVVVGMDNPPSEQRNTKQTRKKASEWSHLYLGVFGEEIAST